MNADFAEEKQQMNDAHSAEVESLNNKFNDAEVEHNTYVAKLNADFAARANETEQKHLKELADKEETHKNELVEIKEANLKSSAASNAAHASELKKAYKSVDKKVELAEKACEKRMKAKVAEVKKRLRLKFAKPKRKQAKKSALLRMKLNLSRIQAICSFVTTASAVLQLFQNMPKSLQNSASFQSQTSL